MQTVNGSLRSSIAVRTSQKQTFPGSRTSRSTDEVRLVNLARRKHLFRKAIRLMVSICGDRGKSVVL